MKNKQVLWIGSGILVLAISAGSFFMWRATTHTSVAQRSADAQPVSFATPNTSSTSAAAANQNPVINGQMPVSNSSQQIISPNTNQSSSQSSAAATTQNQTAAASKLLDPTTFAQYDKYKNDASASYIDLQSGTGAALASGQKAAVYYRGWLTNGQLFDQSRAGSDGNLQPFVLTLGQHQVISGWEQDLAGMKVGGVRLFIVPPAVGYGATAQGSIPANSVLVFQVQLAAVQ